GSSQLARRSSIVAAVTSDADDVRWNQPQANAQVRAAIISVTSLLGPHVLCDGRQHASARAQHGSRWMRAELECEEQANLRTHLQHAWRWSEEYAGID
ncbi:hypothetical protein, partial [Micromonospora qiuiae]|uniref:hypothetical protein n=1 Tax=Micromonospora qiuiae TaxID=502268 RepID=UPI0019521CBC